MINPLPFVVILCRGKSKPLHVSMQVLQPRKTHKKRIVYHSYRRRKFRIDTARKKAYLASSFYYQYN